MQCLIAGKRVEKITDRRADTHAEPGVLSLYAVYEKENPTRIRVFEIYTDENAYKTHHATPHFQKFRAATDRIVISRRLLDAIPIIMLAKGRCEAPVVPASMMLNRIYSLTAHIHFSAKGGQA